MAYIKTLKDNELIGGQDRTDVYPISSTQAIYSQNPDGTIPSGIKHQKLEDRLKDHEDDAQELHRKTEKLVAYLNNDKSGETLEITGNVNYITLTGSASIETFGDEPSRVITTDEMSSKRMTVSSAGAILFDEAVATTTFIIPDIVGTYVSTFYCTYNGVTKSANTVTNINLRKYFGFAEEAPTDPTALGISHFSNGVGCTVTIPATGSGFKRIYFAVPNGMTISRIVQPDALNAPLAISQVGTIKRTIAGENYVYKLYQSTDEIDSSVSKRLTIN